MKTLTVDLGERSYPIYIGAGLLADDNLFTQHIHGSSAVLVTSDNIPQVYVDTVKAHLKPYKYSVVVLPDGEKHKTLDTLNQIYTALLEENLDRKTTLIALGGGVIGDVVGYAAASYQRGVNFIQVPTTLLAQVDSSVGGKTAVNHPLGKNMIGAFHQPQAVIADIDVFKTLPSTEISAGLAEVIKYGALGNESFMAWQEQNIEKLIALDQDALIYAVAQSCEDKARIVAMDEKESGARALLNLGHTFGHAIETFCGYGKWLHGQAVGAGMVMASKLSVLNGWLSETDHQRFVQLITKAKLPIAPPPEMSPDDFMSNMMRDKKVLNGVMRLVLLKGLGDAVVTDEYDVDALKECLHFDYSQEAK